MARGGRGDGVEGLLFVVEEGARPARCSEPRIVAAAAAAANAGLGIHYYNHCNQRRGGGAVFAAGRRVAVDFDLGARAIGQGYCSCLARGPRPDRRAFRFA